MTMYKQKNGEKIALTPEEEQVVLDSRKLTSEQIKELSNNLYNEIESHFYLQANGRVYNFDISKKIDFFAKLVMMPDDGELLWTAHDNVEYSHTKQDAINVFMAAEGFLKPLFDAKKLDKAGDGSLSNLKAIQEAQDILKGDR